MPKINIYVPDEMKARMDNVDRGANWSAIAQRAFELELNHLERIKEVKSRTDVIERLRQDKESTAAERVAHGRKYGVDWAKLEASYPKLSRIAHIDVEQWSGAGSDAGAFTTAELVYMEVFDEEDRPRMDQVMHFYGFKDERELDIWLDDAYVRGFVEGAQDVWEEVKNRI